MTKEEYVKKYNAIATKSIKDVSMLYARDFDINKVDIKYNNSYNILELIKDFNNRYHDILFDYEIIENKLHLADSFDIDKYIKSNDYELLQLLLRKPNHKVYDKAPLAYLKLSCFNDTYSAKITNTAKVSDINYESKEINVNPNIIKEYLNLGSKYSSLIFSYRELKKYFGKSFFEGEINLYIKLDGDLLSKVNSITLMVGLTKGDFEVKFDLSTKDIKVVDIKNYSNNVLSNEDIMNIISNLYMHKNIISCIDPNEKEEINTLDKQIMLNRKKYVI